jgi:GNAT superfamily N-acetyltransferase
LSPEARQARFFGAKARLGDAEIRHLCRPDGWDHLALGAFARTPAGADAELLGAVRCLRLPAQRNAAELAITVADDARGRGLGRVLLAALLRQARARGIRELHCEVLAVNRPMRALAVAFGAVVKGGEEGTILYRLPLSPTPGGFHVPASDGWLLPLMDPVAAHHACGTLFDQATAHGVAVLDGLGAYCLPGALLAQAGEPRPAPAEAA